MNTAIIEGKLIEYREDGKGTPIWCIHPTEMSEQADIEFGLVSLRNGDLLTIFNKLATREVVWQGPVKLVPTGKHWPSACDYLEGFEPAQWQELCQKRLSAKIERIL